jgi:monofunctional biosynthetic peptidoglycan transglycosylase
MRRWLIRTLLALTVLAIGLPVASLLLLRWVPPPTSARMLQERTGALFKRGDGLRPAYDWVGWAEIAPAARLAVVAAEDQNFPRHHGFDRKAIEAALEAHQRGSRLRGASTISQQVAKNLFLWPGRSILRKGIEAYLTVLIEALWPKRRILEVYLNVAEMGPGVYGVGAASRLYFHKPAAALTAREASLLAAVLPSPKRLHAERPSAYVQRRAAWIRGQMEQLGGRAYLARL